MAKSWQDIKNETLSGSKSWKDIKKDLGYEIPINNDALKASQASLEGYKEGLKSSPTNNIAINASTEGVKSGRQYLNTAKENKANVANTSSPTVATINNNQFKNATANPNLFSQAGFDFVGYKKYYDALPTNEKLNLLSRKLTPEEVAYKYNPQAYGEIVSGNINESGLGGAVFSGISKGLFNIKGAARGIMNTLSGLVTGKKDTIKEDPGIQAFQNARAKEMEKKSFVENIPENISQIVTQMAPSIVTGGVPGLFLAGTQAGGLNAQQAMDEGATPGQALLYGGVTGTAEGMLEKFGFIPGLGGNVVKGLTGVGSKNIRNIAEDYLKRSAVEGLEEVAMEPIQNISKGLIYDDKISFNPMKKETYGDNGIFPLQRMAESGALGFLAGNVLGGIQVPAQITAAKKIEKEIGKNIQDDLYIASNMPQNSLSYKLGQDISKKGLNTTWDEYYDFTKQLKSDVQRLNTFEQQNDNAINRVPIMLRNMSGQQQSKFNFKYDAQRDRIKNNAIVQRTNDNTLPTQNNVQELPLNAPVSGADLQNQNNVRLKSMAGEPQKTSKVKNSLQGDVVQFNNEEEPLNDNVLQIQNDGQKSQLNAPVSRVELQNQINNAKFKEIDEEFLRKYNINTNDLDNIEIMERISSSDGGKTFKVKFNQKRSDDVKEIIVDSEEKAWEMLNKLKSERSKFIYNKNLKRIQGRNLAINQTPDEGNMVDGIDTNVGNKQNQNEQQKDSAQQELNTDESQKIKEAGDKAYKKVMRRATNKMYTPEERRKDANKAKNEAEYEERNKIISENNSDKIATAQFKEKQKRDEELKSQADKRNEFKSDENAFKMFRSATIFDVSNNDIQNIKNDVKKGKVKVDEVLNVIGYAKNKGYLDSDKIDFLTNEVNKLRELEPKKEEPTSIKPNNNNQPFSFDEYFEYTSRLSNPKRSKYDKGWIVKNNGGVINWWDESLSKNGVAGGIPSTWENFARLQYDELIKKLNNKNAIFTPLEKDIINYFGIDSNGENIRNGKSKEVEPNSKQIQDDNNVLSEVKNDSIEATADAADKPAKFKKEVISARFEKGDIDLPASSYKGLAIHKSVKSTKPLVFGDRYTVVHKNSKIMIRSFANEKQAKLFTQILADTIDTNVSEEEIRKIFTNDDFRKFYDDLIKWVENSTKTFKGSNEDNLFKWLKSVKDESITPDEFIKRLQIQGSKVSGFTLPMREQIMRELIQGVISGDENIEIKVEGDGELTIVNSPVAISTVLDRLKIKLPEQQTPPKYEKQSNENNNQTNAEVKENKVNKYQEELDNLKMELADIEAKISKIENNKSGSEKYLDEVNKRFVGGMVGGSGKNVKKLNKIKSNAMDKSIEMAKVLNPLYEKRSELIRKINDIESGKKEKIDDLKEQRKINAVKKFLGLKSGDSIDLGNGALKIAKKNARSIITTGGTKYSIQEITGIFDTKELDRILQIIDGNKIIEQSETTGNKQEVENQNELYFTTNVSDVNKKTWYHGTGTAGLTAKTLDPQMTKVEGLFGKGIYLTDNIDIAQGYAKSRGKKTSTPVIYKASVNIGKVLNLENPLEENIYQIFKDVAIKLDEEYGYNSVKELDKLQNEKATGDIIFNKLSDEISIISNQEQVPAYEFEPYFDDMTAALQKSGYDAYTHIGGKRTNKKPHQVLIVLDPNDLYSKTGRKNLIVDFTPINDENQPKESITKQNEQTEKQTQPDKTDILIDKITELVDAINGNGGVINAKENDKWVNGRNNEDEETFRRRALEEEQRIREVSRRNEKTNVERRIREHSEANFGAIINYFDNDGIDVDGMTSSISPYEIFIAEKTKYGQTTTYFHELFHYLRKTNKELFFDRFDYFYRDLLKTTEFSVASQNFIDSQEDILYKNYLTKTPIASIDEMLANEFANMSLETVNFDDSKGFKSYLPQKTIDMFRHEVNNMLKELNISIEQNKINDDINKQTQYKNSVERIEKFKRDSATGEPLNLNDFKNEANFILNNEDTIKQELTSYTVNELKKKANPYTSNYYTKKQEFVDGIYKDYLTYIYYATSGKDTISYSMGKGTIYDSLISQINKALETLTQEKLDTIQANNKIKYEESVERKKKRIEGFKNPTTLEEFESKKRITKLSTDEQVKYDELYALDRKAKREEKKQEMKPLPNATLGDYQIIEDVDTRDNSKLWVIKLKDRVATDEFNKIRDALKRFNIGYSRFKQGFISKEDPTEVIKQIIGETPIEAKSPIVKDNSQKLFDLADNMQNEIDNLKRPRLDNTARRARMADNAIEQAESLERMQSTIRNIAQAMQDGNLKLINNIDSRAQINTLISVLNRAKIKYADENLAEIRNNYNQYKSARASIKDIDAIPYAEMPQETIYSDRLADIIKKIENKKGYTLIANRFKKFISKIKEPRVVVLPEQLRQDLEKVIKEIDTFNFMEDELSQRKRIERLGIESKEELRAYLREFIQYTAKKKDNTASDNIRKMERDLIGKKFEGYFPTPKPIVEKMLELADIQDGDKILEPSAGKGNILDVIVEKYPELSKSRDIIVFEIQPALKEILEKKGYNVVGNDFIDKNYDFVEPPNKIIMNPPFENLQDVDHVMRAYSLLKPGGKIVAIMSESPFFRQDKKATAFREWLDSVNGTSEKLPEGSFKNSDRSTGVNTRIVVIEKENVISNVQSLNDVEAELAQNVIENLPESEISKTLGNERGAVRINFRQDENENTSERIMGKDVADRWNNAVVKKLPLMQRIKERLSEMKKNITRGRYSELERGSRFAELRFKLLQFTKGKDIALTRTLEMIQGLTVKMKPKDYELFNMKVVFMDLLEDAKDGKALPFGLRDEVQVQEILDNIDAEIKGNNVISEALEKRFKLWEALKNEYINTMKSIGFNVDDRFKKQNYFRHLVIEYVQADRMLTGTGKKLKTPRGAGYLKKRAGSEKDIVKDYIASESEVMAQMLYDIERARLIKYVDTSPHNIKKTLKKQAKEINDELMEEVYNKEAMDDNGDILLDKKGRRASPTEKLMKKYAYYMAKSFDNLKNMKEQGNLWLGENGEFSNISFASSGNIDETNKLFKYLSELAKQEEVDGNIEARTILKYHKVREQLIQETLGSAYRTWENIIPEGYDTWQPTKGNAMYMTYSVPENIAEQLVNSMVESVIVDKKQLQKVLVQGMPYSEMVLPNEVIATLDNLVTERTFSAYAKAIQGWKIWQLLSPRRFIKYNLRNISGDLDKIFLGNFGAVGRKNLQKAIKDLALVLYKGEPLTGDIKDFFMRGGLSSFLQTQEMGQLNQLKLFLNTTKDRDYNIFRQYWKQVRLATDFREGVLRYAAYLSYLEELNNNNGKAKRYVASLREEVEALKDYKDRAYQLSNDLLGAYDDVSPMGQNLSDKWMPFYRFTETNFKGYFRAIKNAMEDNKKMVTLGRASVAAGVKVPAFIARNMGRLIIGMLGLSAVLDVWNNLLFGDEEDELPEEVRKRVHIILWRDDNGRPIYFTRLGAISDLLEWFGLGTATQDVKDLLNGKKTLREQLEDMAKAPVTKVVNSILPFEKMGAEFLTGLSLFPDPFNPKVIRDRGQYLANSFGLTAEYNAIFNKPSRGYSDSFIDFVFYKSDPKENAYYSILNEKLRFRKAQGERVSSTFFPDDKANALYNYKLALRYKDKNAADKYLNEYLAYGGTKKGYIQSIKSLSPTGGLGENRDAFIKSLSPDMQAKLDKAEEFYKEMLNSSEFVPGEYTNAYIEFSELRSVINAKYKKMKDGELKPDKETVLKNQYINQIESYEGELNKLERAAALQGKNIEDKITKAKTKLYKSAIEALNRELSK